MATAVPLYVAPLALAAAWAASGLPGAAAIRELLTGVGERHDS